MKLKRFMSVLLAAAMVLSLFSVVQLSAGAAEVAPTIEAESETATEFEPTTVETADMETQLGADSYEDSEALADPGDDDEDDVILEAPALSVSNGIDGLTASWNSIENASHYVVYYKAEADDEWISFDTTDTSYTFNDVVSGTLYNVKVQAIGDGDVEGAFSKTKSMTYIARAEITGLSFNGTSNVLTYNGVDGANKYQIAKKKNGDKSYIYYTTTSNSFTDNNVVKATSYKYQVRAMYQTEKNGTAYGAWSTTYSVVTLAQTNVSLSNKSNGIRAQWNAVSGATRYAVYYKSADDTSWSTASTTNTYYPILNVKSGKLYYVQVRAVAGNVSGNYSKKKAMTFIGRTAVTTSNAAGGINVSWKYVDGANRFQIAKKKKGASSYSYYYSDGTSYLDSEVSGNTVYLYQVRAMYQTENSGTAYGEWSTTSSLLRLVQPIVSLSNKSNGLRVDWSKVGGATKYIVYIKAASATKWQSATTTNTYYPMLTVKSGTLYYVQVRPIGGGVYGPYSKPKSMTYIGPANLKLSMSGSDLMLSWNGVTGANKIQIAKLKKGNSAYDYIYTTGTSYVDKSVTGSKDFYSYQVRAMYTTQNSGTAYGAWSSAWHFNNGKIVIDGYQTINGSKYYYKNGVIQKNGIVGSAKEGYCYADKNGKIDTSYRGAVTSNGADWIVQNGVAKKVTTAADRNLFRAMKLVAKITTSSMTKEQKLKACFEHLKKNYTEKNPRIPHYKGIDWPVIYANDILANGVGNCFSFGATFCYMAKAIGYTNVYACSSGGHGWAEINGLVYDPEWARHRNKYTYFGLSYNMSTDVNYKAGIAPGEPWMHVKV